MSAKVVRRENRESKLTVCLGHLVEDWRVEAMETLYEWAREAKEKSELTPDQEAICKDFISAHNQDAVDTEQFVHFLLENGADPHARTILARTSHSAKSGHENWTESWTMLMLACHAGDAGSARALASVSDLNAMGREGIGPSALFLALGKRSAPCVAALVEAGCDVSSPNADGKPPLSLAARLGQEKSVAALLARADPKAANSNGATALMEAAAGGSVQCARILLPLSDPNAKDATGMTALMNAAESGSWKMVELLLPASDVFAKDDDGGQALDYALGAAGAANAWLAGDSWFAADMLAANMSAQDAVELIKQAPAGAHLPLCKAVAERHEIQTALRLSAEHGEGRLVARSESQKTRRI